MILCISLLEEWHLAHAWTAPRSPEVEEYILVTLLLNYALERYRSAVNIWLLNINIGRGKIAALSLRLSTHLARSLLDSLSNDRQALKILVQRIKRLNHLSSRELIALLLDKHKHAEDIAHILLDGSINKCLILLINSLACSIVCSLIIALVDRLHSLVIGVESLICRGASNLYRVVCMVTLNCNFTILGKNCSHTLLGCAQCKELRSRIYIEYELAALNLCRVYQGSIATRLSQIDNTILDAKNITADNSAVAVAACSYGCYCQNCKNLFHCYSLLLVFNSSISA